MSSVRVWGAPLSQPTRAVLWACGWLGLKADFAPVNAIKGDHRSADFLKLNPNGTFPVIADGDFVLWESHAVLRYLATTHGRKGDAAFLYPTGDAQACARIDAWLDWKHNVLRPGAAGIVRRRVMRNVMKDISNHSMRFDLEEISEAREVRLLEEALRILEQRLSECPFVAGGDKPSLADIAIASEVDQLRLLPPGAAPPDGAELSKSYPSISRWLEGMRATPGYSESHKGFHDALAGVAKLRAASKL
eukprot:CAMPEP_0202082424 /NCGR_PEP_ID=MMETSP0964-20121228/19333_1 /ASSEMBLY_ACC=CAM_ASM_000500 /TAXON_ID=4773 /ORGANISM="Schizochytrium aggregatum, Strain ATCC28209" /LENGTH=247 /DNA_ID=CAMNT_0048650059 /DNA_START=35 /DNA_END=778 /DNA_ORIENTATION=-